MGKNSKGNAGDLPAALEKVLSQLTQEVDRKLGQLQEAIAAARDALRRRQGDATGKKKKGKSAPSWDGGTPPPPKKKKSKDSTASRWDANPPPPRQPKVAGVREGKSPEPRVTNPETAWDGNPPPPGRRPGVAPPKGPVAKKRVAKKPAVKKPAAKKPAAKKPGPASAKMARRTAR